jgi:zinc resistance-associated protein
MRRIKAPLGERVPVTSHKIVRIVPILLAGCVGYLLGSAHIADFQAADISAAEAIALRFPQDVRNASLTTAVALRSAATKLRPQSSANLADASAPLRDAQRALLEPIPGLPAMAQAGQDPTTPARVQMASAEDADMSAPTVLNTVAQTAPRSLALPPAQKSASSAAVAAPPAPKVAAVAPHRPAVEQRPGYVLNDAQIASIKERLHLTPGQEEMWPAVEAALRDVAYTHQQPPHGRSAPAGTTQTAAVDPEAVQNLKSAAVPLIMSFNTEQKDEVRNLVHVMGLDQLASQF